MISDEELAAFEHEYRGRNEFGTHWEGCYEAHADCLVLRLIGEAQKLRAALKKIAESEESDLGQYAVDTERTAREALDEIRKGRI